MASPSARPLRVGIIGLGRVAHLLEDDALRPKPCTHLGAWQRQSGVKVVAGCDVDAERRTRFRERVPEANVYAEYETMLAEEQLDFVSICAYADQRKAMVVAAADTGIRGIWCEKALAASLDEVAEMRGALERNDTRLIVNFPRRWNARYRQAKSLLDAGAIGRLQTITVHFSGNMLHTGTHAIDVLRLFTGEVTGVQAWLKTGDGANVQSGYRFDGGTYGEDYGGFALLHFANGAVAAVHGEDKAYFRFEFELIGERGMIRVGNAQEELWLVQSSRRFEGFSELERAPWPDYRPNNAWTDACADLVSAVVNGTPVACDLEAGAKSLAIALAMHASHREDHRPVSMNEDSQPILVRSR